MSLYRERGRTEIVTNRQSLDAQRDLVDALLDYQATRLALEADAGWTDHP